MRKIMGLLVSIVLLIIQLTGCAGAPAEKDTAAVPESEAVTNAPEASSNTGWPRTYIDSAGNEVVLEKQPERVLSVFHAMYPDYLYALDVYPVGAASADTLLNQWAAYKDYTADQTVVDIGNPTAPNLEKILELEPDLILAASIHEDIYDALSQIAPTVILDYAQINENWKYGVEEFAKLLGKEEQVNEVIVNVEEAVVDASEKLQSFRAKDETVIFISVTEKDIWPYTVAQLQVIYDEENGLGLKAPEGYSDITDRSSAISLEALAEYNPDHIFLMTDYGDETAQQWLTELTSNSVWASITAVQKENLYLTDRSIFAFNSPIATQYGVNFVVDSLGE